MPRRQLDEKRELCTEGRSFNRKKHEHAKGSTVICYRCETVMGCVWCCEPLQELICLVCHNWASRRGVEKHGDVGPNDKVQHVRTDRGWKHWQQDSDARGEVVRLVEKTLDRP